MELLKDQDATLEPLKGKTVAVLGYGNQGRAQSLNLRDSGVRVIVGNRDDAYRQQAIADGFKPLSIREAAEAGDFLLILTSDETQPVIWNEQIAPGVRPGKTLVWARRRAGRSTRRRSWRRPRCAPCWEKWNWMGCWGSARNSTCGCNRFWTSTLRHWAETKIKPSRFTFSRGLERK